MTTAIRVSRLTLSSDDKGMAMSGCALNEWDIARGGGATLGVSAGDKGVLERGHRGPAERMSGSSMAVSTRAGARWRTISSSRST